MDFNFNQNTTVDSLDKVPTDFQGLYKEAEDGKFKLDSEHEGVKAAISAITGLNSALTKSRGEMKTAKGKAVDLSPLVDFGDSPASILEAFNIKLVEVKKASKGKGTSAEDIEKAIKAAKEAMSKTHGEEIVKLNTKSDALKTQLYELLVTSASTTALADAKAIDASLVMPFIKDQVKVEEKDGNFKVFVVGDTGDVRYSGTTGDPMSIKELVAETKATEKYMPLFQSESHSGGGSDAHGHGKQPINRGKGTEKTSQEKIASALEKRKR